MKMEREHQKALDSAPGMYQTKVDYNSFILTLSSLLYTMPAITLVQQISLVDHDKPSLTPHRGGTHRLGSATSTSDPPPSGHLRLDSASLGHFRLSSTPPRFFRLLSASLWPLPPLFHLTSLFPPLVRFHPPHGCGQFRLSSAPRLPFPPPFRQ